MDFVGDRAGSFNFGGFSTRYSCGRRRRYCIRGGGSPCAYSGPKWVIGFLIRPGVRVTFPWKLVIGDHCWIGDNATLYNIEKITIGEHSVISQDAYLCAGSHDYCEISFPLIASPITVKLRVLDCRACVYRARRYDWPWGNSSGQVPSFSQTLNLQRSWPAFRLGRSEFASHGISAPTSLLTF